MRAVARWACGDRGTSDLPAHYHTDDRRGRRSRQRNNYLRRDTHDRAQCERRSASQRRLTILSRWSRQFKQCYQKPNSSRNICFVLAL